MNLSLDTILLTLYYIGTAIGYVIKEILWLRVVIIFAGLCMLARGIIIQNYIVVFWMSVFVIINTFQVIRILIEKRPVKLSDDVQDLYDDIFSDMTTKEFVLFWKMGLQKELKAGDYLCRDNIESDELIQILDGTAAVRKNGKDVAKLSRGYFIAEMQYLMEENPSADVVAVTDVHITVWKHAKLMRLKETYPNLYNKFHLILSKDLTYKLKRYL
ncbi:MAG: cyclic nucleotide-binding domain-containing protein [Candidatus Cloacimonetes bacterium]|nr:cyclic nucleotide-binding domain-containing protein [Candidatus Cloacimonadota bacterium]